MGEHCVPRLKQKIISQKSHLNEHLELFLPSHKNSLPENSCLEDGFGTVSAEKKMDGIMITKSMIDVPSRTFNKRVTIET